MFSYSNLYLTFDKELCMVWITTKALKSGLKLHLERFKNQKFSYPGKGDTPSPGPHPPQPRPYGPRRVSSALRASLVPPWKISQCTSGPYPCAISALRALLRWTQQHSKSRPPPFEILWPRLHVWCIMYDILWCLMYTNLKRPSEIHRIYAAAGKHNNI